MSDSKGLESRQQLLTRLDAKVNHLLDTYRQLTDTSFPVYEGWSALDVLSHLTYWHENFARIVIAQVNGAAPQPPKGNLDDLNQAGVESMRGSSLAEILARFEHAHQQIQTHVLNPAVTVIRYRKGSLDRTPERYMDIVIGHIAKHLHDVISRR